MAALTLLRDVYVADLSRTLSKGVYEVGDGPGQVPSAVAARMAKNPRFGSLDGETAQVAAPPAADMPSNEDLFSALVDLDDEAREGYWAEFELDALNAVLLDRFEVDVSGRDHGTAANMIEKRLGL